MSRIGRKPISVPSGVKVTIEGRTVTVTGPKGTLSRALPGPARRAARLRRPLRPREEDAGGGTAVAAAVSACSVPIHQQCNMHSCGSASVLHSM